MGTKITLTKRVAYLEKELASLIKISTCEHKHLSVNIDSDGYLWDYAICRDCGLHLSYKPYSGRKFTKQVKKIFKQFA